MTRISEKQAAQWLGEVERKHNLFTLTLDGWVAWRAVRGALGLSLTGVSIERQRVGASRLNRLGLLIDLPRLLSTLLLAKRRTLLIKSYGSALRERVGGKLRDIYFDALLESGLDAHKLYLQNTATAVRPGEMLFPFQTNQLAVAAIARLLARLRVRRDTTRVAKAIFAAVSEGPGASVSYDWIARRLESVRWQAFLYTWLIRAVSPTAVLAADAGEYALNIACKRRGVKYVELQHGVFTEDHPDAVPLYALDVATPDALLLPDVLAVYGEYWARRLQSTALSRQKIVPVGSDALDRWRVRRRSRREPAGDCMNVVVTTQGLEREGLIDWLLGVLAVAPAGKRWRLILKLHPVYDSVPEAYARLAPYSQVEIVAPTSPVSVYELLASASVHASISSASHYDALGLGVPTVIIPLPGAELVQDLADGETGFLGDDPAILWACAAGGDLPDCASGAYFAVGYVERMRGVIG